MKEANKVRPPHWAEQMLKWYCKPELLEDLHGDLNEYFDRNVKTKGIKRAKLIYIIDVFKFFRLYTIRKPEFMKLLIHWMMLGSYIKTSTRSIARNKLFSSINIIGLAISMSVGLLMISFLSDLLSYDDFHEKKDRIYRVITESKFKDQTPVQLASTSVKAGLKIQETLTGIESLTILRNGFGGDAQVGDKTIPIGGLFADQSFFKVFSFPLLEGNRSTALKDPHSVVVTEKTAKKLFGQTSILGKEIKLDTVIYTVTGVMKDIPKFSHIQFESLASFSSLEQTKPNDSDGDFLSWGSVYINYVYIVLPQNKEATALQPSLNKLCASENTSLKNQAITLSLQPIKNIVLGKKLANQIGPFMPSLAIWILVGLASVVVLSACFNYTNLSIARAMRRSREVGIRKVIGALRSHVLGQFISESVIIALLAVVFSFVLYLFLRTEFKGLHPYLDTLVSLDLSVTIILYFILFAVVVGVASGLLPAVFFSRLNAIKVLKDTSSLKVFRRVTMRKVLIVTQYTFSLIFITTTIIGYNQYKSFLTFDLGYKTDNIINIWMQGNKPNLLAKELSEIPSVNMISRSRMVTSIGSMFGTSVKYGNMQEGQSAWLNRIDENYLPLHKHKLLAGRNFAFKPIKSDETEVIVNEQLLKRFDIAKSDPQKALGEVITVDDKKLTIIGVLKDFHQGTVENPIEPMLFRYLLDERGGYLNVKVSSTDLPSTLASVAQAWKKIDKVHPLNAEFYDDQIQKNYAQFSMIVKVIGFLSLLAIVVASMGLFGMVVFTAETKLKEISIRKVLGAGEANLIFMLSKGFLVLLLIAALIALPATYLLFDKIVLINFVYHKPVSMVELSSGALIIMIIAFIMIGSQTLTAAKANPAEVLKSE